MILAISFSGMFSSIGTAFKGLSSAKFASILNNVVMPLAGVGLAIKNAASGQKLPGSTPVQPQNTAPNTAGAAGALGGGNGTATKWYANPAIYLGGAGVALVLVLVLLPRSRGRR